MKKDSASSPPPTATARAGYHHGDLRKALIDAAIAIIDDDGLDALTMRACAATAGVSHAAPKHHFGNRQGLLTALAIIAYRRFHEAIAEAQRSWPDSPADRLRAAGAGYVGFALGNPGLFRLMFSAERLDWESAELSVASEAAYEQLGDTVRPYQRIDSEAESQRLRLLVWSTVHGYTHLLLEGHFRHHGVSPDGLSHLPDLVPLLTGSGQQP